MPPPKRTSQTSLPPLGRRCAPRVTPAQSPQAGSSGATPCSGTATAHSESRASPATTVPKTRTVVVPKTRTAVGRAPRSPRVRKPRNGGTPSGTPPSGTHEASTSKLTKSSKPKGSLPSRSPAKAGPALVSILKGSTRHAHHANAAAAAAVPSLPTARDSPTDGGPSPQQRSAISTTDSTDLTDPIDPTAKRSTALHRARENAPVTSATGSGSTWRALHQLPPPTHVHPTMPLCAVCRYWVARSDLEPEQRLSHFCRPCRVRVDGKTLPRPDTTSMIEGRWGLTPDKKRARESWTKSFQTFIEHYDTSFSNLALSASPTAAALGMVCRALAAHEPDLASLVKSLVNLVPQYLASHQRDLPYHPEGPLGTFAVTIDPGVTEIEQGAFAHCRGLERITLPPGLTTIGSGAFGSCESLAVAALPAGVTGIGRRAFQNCSSLTEVTLPPGLTEMNGGTFAGCSSLVTAVLPSCLSILKDEAFFGCSSLATIEFPASLVKIGGHAMSGCSSLTEVTLPPNLVVISGHAFSGCTLLTRITLPVGCVKIGNSAFGECPGRPRRPGVQGRF